MEEPAPRAGEIDALLRRYTVEAEMIVRAFCERHAMHHTDAQALVIIMDTERGGDPITPAGLARVLSMSTGAVSALLDRLERTGHIKRSRESADRRLVHLHYTPEGMALGQEFFRPLGERSERVKAAFSAAELASVERFLSLMNDALADYRAELGRDA